MYVYKRDGRKDLFSKTKVISAILSAGGTEFEATEVVKKIILSIHEGQNTVEEIQQSIIAAIENPKVRADYQAYKEARDLVREKSSPMYLGFKGIVTGDDKETLRENSNKAAERLPTQRDLIAGNMVKQHTLKHLMPKHVASAHNAGDIHIHDTDYIGMDMTNCCLVALEGMLSKGFTMGNARIEQPNSITTAAAITAQIIAQVASHQYGGTTIPEIDKALAPYVTKTCKKHLSIAQDYGMSDKLQVDYANRMTLKDIEDAIQGLEYEINTLHTSNGQTPFTTLTFGRGTSWAEREIQKAILKQRIKGLGKDGITPVFPKLVFFQETKVNRLKTDPNYDIKQLAVKCSSKRLYPDWIDVDLMKETVGHVNGEIPSPMGCRSFLAPHPDGYAGRNNLGVVTVNVPRCAIKAVASKSPSLVTTFYEELDKSIALAKEALDVRVATCKQIKAKVAPIMYMEGVLGIRTDDPEELIFDRFFSNNRASVSMGYIGIYETVKLLTGNAHHEDADAGILAEEILRYMRSVTNKWKAEENIGFSLYGTPSEGLCGRFCKLDTQYFGDIKDITDKGYYQNGYNVDVRADINPIDKATAEQSFPKHASGGFISYGELPSMVNNLDGLQGVIEFGLDHIPYYAVNTPSDSCFECGHEGEFEAQETGYKCPSCSNSDPYRMNVIRRVSGYLTSPNHRKMPEGKHKEVLMRKKNV